MSFCVFSCVFVPTFIILGRSNQSYDGPPSPPPSHMTLSGAAAWIGLLETFGPPAKVHLV